MSSKGLPNLTIGGSRLAVPLVDRSSATKLFYLGNYEGQVRSEPLTVNDGPP